MIYKTYILNIKNIYKIYLKRENMGKFDNIKKVKNTAPMKEISKKEIKPKMKKKVINLPIEWEEIIKKEYPGSVTSYILMAIKEKLKREELL